MQRLESVWRNYRNKITPLKMLVEAVHRPARCTVRLVHRPARWSRAPSVAVVILSCWSMLGKNLEYRGFQWNRSILSIYDIGLCTFVWGRTTLGCKLQSVTFDFRWTDIRVKLLLNFTWQSFSLYYCVNLKRLSLMWSPYVLAETFHDHLDQWWKPCFLKDHLVPWRYYRYAPSSLKNKTAEIHATVVIW